MTQYTDIATLNKLSEPNPQLLHVLKNYTPPPPPPADVNLEAIRQVAREDGRRIADAVLLPSIKESTKEIPMRDGFMSELRILEPVNRPDTKMPVFVLYYGGGFMHGNNYQFVPYAVPLVDLFDAVVVLPNYRLAPEHPFPVGANDAWDSFTWVAENLESLGGDVSAGFVVGGASAGANLAAVVAQKALDENLKPLPTGVSLNIPVVFTTDIVPEAERHLFVSRETNVNAPGFNGAMLDRVTEALRADTKSPMFSPFNAKNPHKGMPTTYFQVAGLDPLRDDGLIYERVLRQNGVKTKMDVYPGVPHGHFTFFPTMEISRQSNVDSIKGFGWLIGKEIDDSTVEKYHPKPTSA